MINLRGVIAPVVTTFGDRDEAVDLDAFATNLRAYVAAGLSGVVVCGSTGEAALLDEEERRSLIGRAQGELPSDALLIVGTGAESTRQCIQRCRMASEHGAHAVLVVAPHYYSSAMTPAALEAHYIRVADESPLPVLLYNIPKYMHFALEPDLVARLASHENIVGMKDSAGDLTRLAGYVQSQGDDFTVLTGHGGSFHQALELGVRGGILAIALFASELTLDIYERQRSGERDGSAESQRFATPLAAEIVGRMGVAGVKAAMDRVGLNGGRVRAPLLPLGIEDEARVDALLRDARVTAAV
jgi:dihydrodipicolinate synthase/N-acetylneuraminate lyase